VKVEVAAVPSGTEDLPAMTQEKEKLEVQMSSNRRRMTEDGGPRTNLKSKVVRGKQKGTENEVTKVQKAKLRNASYSALRAMKDKSRMKLNRSFDCVPTCRDFAQDDKVSCEDCEYSTVAVGKGGMFLTCDHAKSGQRLIVNADDSCAKFVRSRDLLRPHLVRALAEGAKLIPLTQGHFAIVDASDFEWLNQYKWHVKKDKNKYYAESQKNGKNIKMHRLITCAPEHLFVDHRDHNGLNNRRWNLRLCTRAENMHNQRPQQGGTSKYKGVCRNKRARKYVSQIGMNGTRKTIGYFDDEIEAAISYDLKAMELFGEFGYLNFPALMRRYKLLNSGP